jgi:hypothetical protein
MATELNSTIINEFYRLISFIRNETDEYQSNKDIKKVSKVPVVLHVRAFAKDLDLVTFISPSAFFYQ